MKKFNNSKSTFRSNSISSKTTQPKSKTCNKKTKNFLRKFMNSSHKSTILLIAQLLTISISQICFQMMSKQILLSWIKVLLWKWWINKSQKVILWKWCRITRASLKIRNSSTMKMQIISMYSLIHSISQTSSVVPWVFRNWAKMFWRSIKSHRLMLPQQLLRFKKKNKKKLLRLHVASMNQLKS